MGASVGTDGGKGAVNVEINIVPFIDLMSCLTAFLLFTAVWANIAQINIQPKGKSRDTAAVMDDVDKPILSILIQADQIWIGVSRPTEFTPIPKKGADQDWEKFEATLAEKKKTSDFEARTDIEIAAESTAAAPVKYQDVIHAMDIALKVKFTDVGLTDPAGLAARPQL